MNKHLALAVAFGFAFTAAAPAFACGFGKSASAKHDTLAMSKPAVEEKTEEAMSTFDPDALNTTFKPKAEKTLETEKSE